MRDPYEVLGLPRTASEQEVTTAYRKLATQSHPALNPGDPNAQTKMAEVNVAYEEIKSGRARYQDYSRPQSGGQRPGGYNPFGGGGFGGCNPFEEFARAAQRTQQRSSQMDGFDPVRQYIQAMRYQEALYALSQIHNRTAEWYFLSAVANFNSGNRVTAMHHIDEAVWLDPYNFEYARTRAQIQCNTQHYSQRSQMFGMPNISSLNTLCMGLCLARLCCRCI